MNSMSSSHPASLVSGNGKAPPTQVSVAYGVLLCSGFTVHHLVAGGEFSSILTMSVMCQCFAIALLGLQVLSSGSAAGISARALGLEALSLCFRLSSTTWLNGYLPVDASGDFVFQGVDMLSLLMVLWLLHHILFVEKRTYQAADDTLPVAPMIIGSLALSLLFHADMNRRPLFDALWMAGLLVGVVSVLPQLWLITRTKGVVQALTSHHIAMMAVSRMLSGTFMWHARYDITCAPLVTGWNHAIWVILGAHLLHLILLGDFAYYYMKAVCSKGLDCQIDMNSAGCWV